MFKLVVLKKGHYHITDDHVIRIHGAPVLDLILTPEEATNDTFLMIWRRYCAQHPEFWPPPLEETDIFWCMLTDADTQTNGFLLQSMD